MNVAKRRRAARWLSGAGIEIGALHNPLAVPAGASVRYVDRMPSEELRRHYPELSGKELAPVSIIGDARNLSAVADATLDFVIANHLVEHLDDPIRGLQEMVRVLRPGGILYVALPEPRVSFDRHRELTSTAHIVAEFRNGTDATREEHYRDWVEKVEANVDGMAGLNEDARAARVRALMELDYSIHFHVWRPDTFLDFLATASREAGLTLEPLEFLPCMDADDDEFIFVFGKGIAPLPRAVPPLPSSDDGLYLRLQHAEARLAAVESSRSWRLTAPLRVALRRAREMRGRR